MNEEEARAFMERTERNARERVCRTCRYYRRTGSEGRCYFAPPTVILHPTWGVQGFRPTTNLDDFCSEYVTMEVERQ